MSPPAGMGSWIIGPDFSNPYSNPTSYPGMYLWANADHVTTSGPTLTDWQDSSGMGHNMSNVIGTPPPQTGSTINSNAAVAFTNANGTQVKTAAAPLITTFTAVSVFVVFQITSFQVFARLCTNDYTDGFFLGFESTGEALTGLYNAPGATPLTSSVPLSLVTPYLGSMTFDPNTPGAGTGTLYVYLNGTLVASNTYTTISDSDMMPPSETITVGNDASTSQGFTGLIRHAVVYDQFFSGSDLINLHRWFGFDSGIIVP